MCCCTSTPADIGSGCLRRDVLGGAAPVPIPITSAIIMKGLSLVGKVKSHSEGRRRSVEVGTRLGAGVEAEGVVAELVSKLRSLVDRRHSRRG